MRKPPLDPSLFTFSSTTGTVTFAAGSTRPTHQGQIVSIVNTSNEIYLYLPVQAGRGGAYNATTGVLTLEIGTATMSSSDALQIVIDDSDIAATGALQAAGNVLLSGINDKLPALNAGQVPVSGTFWQATQPVSGSVSINNLPSSQAVTGTFWQATQPVSGPVTNTQLTARLPILSLSGTRLQVEPSLATDAATATNQASGNATLSGIDSKMPALSGGNVPVAPNVTRGAGNVDSTTQRVSLAADGPAVTALIAIDNDIGSPSDAPATSDSGAASGISILKRLAQLLSTLALKLPAFSTAGTPSADVLTVQGAGAGQPLPVTNNNPTPVATSYSATGAIANGAVVIGPIDCAGFQMVALQTIAVGAGGALRAEWSIDSTSKWDQAMMLSTTTGSAVVTPATTVTAGSLVSPVYNRWFRVVTTSAVTSGGYNLLLQLFVNCPLSAGAQAVNLLTGSNVGLSSPASTSDIASTALTSTATSASIIQGLGVSFMAEVDLTASSGSGGTLDIAIDEAIDAGGRWYRVFDFPRITGGTAAGVYRSPKLLTFGGRIRYVRTVGGTGGSFTHSITRSFCNDSLGSFRQRFDYAISLPTLSSATATLLTPNCTNVQMVLAVGAITTTAPALQLQNSDDRGATWYNIGNPLTAVANTPVSLTVNNIQPQEIRAIVATAGVGVTPNYVLLKGF